MLDIQFDIQGKLSVMTMGAEVVRAQQFHLTHYGEDASGAQLLIGGGLTAGASSLPLLRARRVALQQLAQSHSADLMHGRPQGHFYGFQIQPGVFAALLQDQRQQPAYFASDFLLDGFDRFFSCSVKVCSRGRKPQILSLRAMSWSQSS